MYAVQAPKAIHKLGKQSLISFLSIFFWRKSLLPFIICTKPLCCGLCKTFHLQHGSFYSPCCMPPSLAVERAGDRALRCIDLVIHVIFAKAYGFPLCFFSSPCRNLLLLYDLQRLASMYLLSLPFLLLFTFLLWHVLP